MAEDKKKILAVDILRPTTVAVPTGGAVDVAKGVVLLVPNEVSAEDAGYLVALGKAVACGRELKAERAKAAAKKTEDK